MIEFTPDAEVPCPQCNAITLLRCEHQLHQCRAGLLAVKSILYEQKICRLALLFFTGNAWLREQLLECDRSKSAIGTLLCKQNKANCERRGWHPTKKLSALWAEKSLEAERARSPSAEILALKLLRFRKPAAIFPSHWSYKFALRCIQLLLKN